MKGRDGGGKCVVLEEALCISDWMLICRSRSRVTNALHTHTYIYIYIGLVVQNARVTPADCIKIKEARRKERSLAYSITSL